MRVVELQIQRLAVSGEGVAFLDARAVFVPGAAPGERIRAALDTSEKVYRAVELEVLEPSSDRRPPPCPVARECGGCDWLHLSLEAQHREKLRAVTSTLEHVGRVPPSAYRLLPLVPAPTELGARRRATLHAVPAGHLGFHGRRSHHVVPIAHCPALAPPLQDLPSRLAQALGGLCRDVDRAGLVTAGGRVALELLLRGKVRAVHHDLAVRLVREGLVAGVVLTPPMGGGRQELFGAPTLDDGDGGLLRPDAFAQAIGEVNRSLVAAAAAALEGVAPLLELYAGSGNFTRALVGPARSVVAVESSSLAVSLAQEAQRGRPGGARWIQGDVPRVVEGLVKEGARFGGLLVDPPRAGARGVGAWARALGVRRLVYVACDAVSLARDTAELRAHGFGCGTLQVFDAFPGTHHVESVMTFEAGTA